MSVLKHYNYPSDHDILALEGSGLAVLLPPGSLVRHSGFAESRGMLVANGDDFLTVLWCIPPGTRHEELINQLAQHIQLEIDADILRDIMEDER